MHILCMKLPSAKPPRDPVCEAIEELLREMEAQGKGVVIEESSIEGATKLSFDGLTAEAANRDVALLRLASKMMDCVRHTRAICDLLRQHEPHKN